MIKRLTPLKRSAKPLKRSPLKRANNRIRPVSRKNKYRKDKQKDVDYLGWLKTQPCAICGRVPSDAAHVGLRGFGQKCPNLQAIPLCHDLHHQEGPESHHKLGRNFWPHHNIDRDELIAFYNGLWFDYKARCHTLSLSPAPDS